MLTTVHAESARADAKEEGLLAAAKEAFLAQGYAATSMDQVAQRARASKTTLYSRFPSKEALFAACIAHECAKSGLSFDPAALADLPIEQALTRIGAMLVDLIWSPVALRMDQIVAGEAARFPEVAEIFYRSGPEKVMAAVAAFFADAAAKGRLAIAPDQAEFVGCQFIAAFKGGLYCELLMGTRHTVTAEERAAYVAQAVELFLKGALPR